MTFVHPKSARLGQSTPLDEVISVSPDGRRVRGWVNHRDYTGFIYTDLFKELGVGATGSDMVATVDYHRYAKQSSAELIAEGAIS